MVSPVCGIFTGSSKFDGYNSFVDQLILNFIGSQSVFYSSAEILPTQDNQHLESLPLNYGEKQSNKFW